MSIVAFLSTHAASLPRDLRDILSTPAPGLASFTAALAAATTPAQVLVLLGRDITWNSVFAGGLQCQLAGQLALRQDLFRTPDAPCVVLGDVSAAVAACVFGAAQEEFHTRLPNGQRTTHRTLAQATLCGMAQVAGLDLADYDASMLWHGPTQRAVVEGVRGYTAGAGGDPAALLQALGFHLASETCAVAEFSLLVESLTTQHPALVAALKQTTVPLQGQAVPAWRWLGEHAHVEEAHAALALEAVQRALATYVGPTPPAAPGWIVAGYQAFLTMQMAFFARIGDATEVQA